MTCVITISSGAEATRVNVTWTPGIPDGPHTPTRVEVAAAGALLGIAKVLKGQGSAEVLKACQAFQEGKQ